MIPVRRFRRCARGSATVEAALVVPMMLIIGLGAAEAGNMVNETHRMKAGLAAGARLLARAQNPPGLEADARNLAVTGERSGGRARIPGWTASQVSVSYRFVPNGTGAYTGGSTIRIVRLESAKPYSGLGLMSLFGSGEVTAVHEERWTGGCCRWRCSTAGARTCRPRTSRSRPSPRCS